MKNYKEILQSAIQNEVEAFEFYRNAAIKMKDPAMKKAFQELADEEAGHKALLEGYLTNDMKEMKFKDENDYKVSETLETQVLSTDMAFKDAIALAMKKEQEAMEMYQQFACASEEGKQKETFLELAKMELGHKARLEDIYTNVAFVEVW